MESLPHMPIDCGEQTRTNLGGSHTLSELACGWDGDLGLGQVNGRSLRSVICGSDGEDAPNAYKVWP